ncbi:DHA2 family efflux MFS transporter permease subunit [Labrenzia aggregata]|uniref:DHA2 family efflux MFS transporter permease subunit n=2 Tax=Roseibium aggregatum TaxID=187304 RepID=A0A926P627_9HYPH|nr:DHA2 family efflux MFS transporter permease subunit [Roseibium aggregatum]
MLEVLDSTIVNVALPHIQSAFGATTDQATWVLTSYIVSAVVIMPLTGFMAKRLGRRRLILGAITGFAVFSVLCGLSWGLGVMAAFRTAQGLFGAFLIPLSQSILFDTFPKEKRGQAMAMFGLGVVVAPVLGPTIGALLTDYYSWRMVFFVNLPIAAFALLLLAGELPKDKPEPVRIDWTGLVLMAISIGALQFVLDQGTTKDWLASRVIQVAALASLISGVLFLARGITEKHNIIDLTLFSDRNFAAGNAIIAGFAVSMFGAIAILPLFVQDLLGYPVLEAGYLFIPRGLAAGFSMVVTGAVLVNRIDSRLLGAAGLGLTAWGNFQMASLNLNASFWQLAWPGLTSGLGMGLVFVPLSTLAFDGIGSDRQDEASGLYGVTRQLGSSIGIAVAGAMIVRGIATDTSLLTQHVTPYSEAARAYLAPLGLSVQSAKGAAVLSAEISRQAAMMSYARIFNWLGWAALVLLPLLLVMHKPAHQTSAQMAH